MSDIIIRRANNDDTEEILTLLSHLNKDDYLGEIWPAWMLKTGNIQLVAVAEDRIAGCVHGRMTAGGDAWAQGLRVRTDFRRRGIATSLLSALENKLRLKGAEAVFAVIGQFNQPSLSTIAKLKWEIALTVVRRSLKKDTPRSKDMGRPLEMPALRSIPDGHHLSASLLNNSNSNPRDNYSSPSDVSLDFPWISSVIRLSGALASRKASAFFRRTYFSMTDEFISQALSEGLVKINQHPPAVAFLDPETEEKLWAIALSGSLAGLKLLTASLTEEASKRGLDLVVDAPADPDIQTLLDSLGFAPPERDGQFVVVRKELSSAGNR